MSNEKAVVGDEIALLRCLECDCKKLQAIVVVVPKIRRIEKVVSWWE